MEETPGGLPATILSRIRGETPGGPRKRKPHVIIADTSSSSEEEYELVQDENGRMKKVKVESLISDGSVTFRNFHLYKNVLCPHYESCFKNCTKGLISNFLKGAFLAAYGSFLIVMLKNKNIGVRDLIIAIKEIAMTQRALVCRTGLMAASFTILFKLLLCCLRAYFQ